MRRERAVRELVFDDLAIPLKAEKRRIKIKSARMNRRAHHRAIHVSRDVEKHEFHQRQADFMVSAISGTDRESGKFTELEAFLPIEIVLFFENFVGREADRRIFDNPDRPNDAIAFFANDRRRVGERLINIASHLIGMRVHEAGSQVGIIEQPIGAFEFLFALSDFKDVAVTLPAQID